MPKIIDRYILRQFVQNFVICFVSLTGLYLVFDAFANLDEFLRYADKQGGLARVMGGYYFYRSIFFFDRTSGILTLIAAMFTVAWVRRHNELTALMAAGIPGGRVVVPVLISGAVIAGVAAANREIVLPSVRTELSREPKDLLGDLGQPLRPRYDNETDILIRGKHTYRNEQRIELPQFGLPPRLDHLGKQLVAENAYFHPGQNDRPAGYLLVGLQQPAELLTQPSVVLGQRPVILSPHDTAWLKPNECFVVSNVNFEQLIGGKAWRLFSSTPQLVQGLRNPSLDFGADVRVTVHTRVLQPVMDLTLLLLGLPLVLTRENRNVFLTVGMCLGLVVAFMLVTLGSQYLGSTYFISPALAAWLPLILFLPLAAGLADQFRA